MGYQKDIVNLNYGLSEVLQLTPRKFKLKDDDSEHIGFVAQEVETIIPEVVSGEDAYYATASLYMKNEDGSTFYESGSSNPHILEESGSIYGGKGLAYQNLTSVLVNAVKELTTEIKFLRASITGSSDINQLKALVSGSTFL